MEQIMFMSEDEASIKRQSGLAVIPELIEDEYEKWLRMYHRDGASGPMGPLAITAMLRHLGVEPPAAARTQEQVDWRKVSRGERVVVSRQSGERSVGEYRGPVDVGTVAVLIDGNNYVSEVNKRFVSLYQNADVPADVDAPAEVRQAPDEAMNWRDVPAGAKVMVLGDSGATEGVFKGIRRGKLAVEVGGEERLLPPDSVVPAVVQGVK